MKRHPGPEMVPVILVMLGLLSSGCTDDSPAAAPESSAEPSSSASTSSDPDDTGTSAPPHLNGNSDPLSPGTYQVSFLATTDEETPEALVDVPSGFDDGDVWYVVSPDGDAFLGLYTVGKVQGDACLRPRHDTVTPGPSVHDLADALVAQKSTHASAPKPVTLAGYQGLNVELTSPKDINGCDKDPALWDGRGLDHGQVDLVWILDVEGQRLVVDAAHGPTSTAAEREELTSMVRSLEFAPAA